MAYLNITQLWGYNLQQILESDVHPIAGTWKPTPVNVKGWPQKMWFLDGTLPLKHLKWPRIGASSSYIFWSVDSYPYLNTATLMRQIMIVTILKQIHGWLTNKLSNSYISYIN